MTLEAVLARLITQARTLARELDVPNILARLDELEGQPVSPFLDEQVSTLREVGTLVEALRLRVRQGEGVPHSGSAPVEEG